MEAHPASTNIKAELKTVFFIDVPWKTIEEVVGRVAVTAPSLLKQKPGGKGSPCRSRNTNDLTGLLSVHFVQDAVISQAGAASHRQPLDGWKQCGNRT